MNQKNLIKATMLGLGIVGVVLSAKTYAASSFMHYEEINGIGTIMVCDPNDEEKCITMMDMNLGASKSGTTCSSADTGACGNLYQRGNNYGFRHHGANGGGVSSKSNVLVNTEGFGPGNFYNSGVFIKNSSDWSNPQNDNLWGGSGDNSENNYGYPLTNPEDRRGPCPEGYHVPSQGERGTLLKYWAENYGITLDGAYPLQYFGDNTATAKFKDDFKIPFAGTRVYADDRAHNINAGMIMNIDGLSSFWSSSPYNTGAGNFKVSNFTYGRGVRADIDSVYSNNSNRRAYGYSLRCFKDPSLGFSSSSDDGGDSLITVNIAALNSGQNTCSGEDYIFPNISALPTVQTISLAKRFSCVFGNAAAKAVTLQLSGDLKDGNGNVISGENVKLSNPDWTATPAVLKNGTTTFSGQTFLGTGKTLFNKVANKIGQAYGSGVEIKITIPAGTPDGLYEGTLVLTY